MSAEVTPLTFWQRFGRFLQVLGRLILFVLVVALVTAGLYYAIPYLYHTLVTPVQNNQAAIEQVRRTQAQGQADLADQLAGQRQRTAQLESDLVAEREARSELEQALTEQVAAMTVQATAQADLAARLESQELAIAGLEQSLDGLDAALTDLDTAVAQVEQATTGPEANIARLQRQALLLQLQQAALKAYLHLAGNNIGQARQALEQADQALEQLRSAAPAEETTKLAEIQQQWEAVKLAIEERPLIAVQQLEILWQLLQTEGENGSAGS